MRIKFCHSLLCLLFFSPTLLIKLFILSKYHNIRSLRTLRPPVTFTSIASTPADDIIEAECEVLADGNASQVRSMKNYTDLTTDQEVEAITMKGCGYIIQHFTFKTDPKSITHEETSFPIAYSILAHHKTLQLILLLSQIYAPQNVYCIHLDRKSSAVMLRALMNVESCFSNIYLASKRENVVYASFSRLQADLNCMKDLLKSSVKWQYLINLSGQVCLKLFVYL